MSTLILILLIVAAICFAIESVWHRSLIAVGLQEREGKGMTPKREAMLARFGWLSIALLAMHNAIQSLRHNQPLEDWFAALAIVTAMTASAIVAISRERR